MKQVEHNSGRVQGGPKLWRKEDGDSRVNSEIDQIITAAGRTMHYGYLWCGR